MKPRILHISADYPDQYQPVKTRAIQGLVEGTADGFDHLVVSLNRIGGPTALLPRTGVIESNLTGGVLALRYAAYPAAVTIVGPMSRLADWLSTELDRIGFKPDLIQAHKLTVEGLMARRLAAQLGVPFVLTLQGNTDQKLLRQRPDRRGIIQQVWHEARAIMAFAPWTADWCTARLGQPQAPVRLNPCLPSNDEILSPVFGPPLIRTAFNLEFWRNKNVKTLLAAVKLVAKGYRDVRLEIAGSGSAAAQARIGEMISSQGMDGMARLVGPIAPESIQSWFNEAAVFALPSRRESFGMVFAESLLAGTPVLFSTGTAIDGFFAKTDFARPVNPADQHEIAAALTDMLGRNKAIKTELARRQAQNSFNFLTRDRILVNYRTFLEEAIS